tara:strand:+ start:318 stop:1997 length:1680 start_codon:yes stop_codon:yes gene_type:complete
MEEYKYDHIYSILKETFNFDEVNNGKYIKDVISLLIESEKNGETFINIDDDFYLFEFQGDGWPNKHVAALENSGLVFSKESPIVFEDRKLSFKKWSRKINKIINILLIKANKNNSIKIKLDSQKNGDKKTEIIKLFEVSDLVFLQGGPGTGKSTLILEIILYYLNHNSNFNIGLSAPTGKASSRLKESLDKKKKINSENEINKIECQTLHRWIYNSINKNCKLKYNLKELDFFVIDEMSMVNINLIEIILNLLAKDCKILLVGDSNQLPPINSCSVWNYIFSNSKRNLFVSSIINLEKVYRNNGDIEEISKLIFNNNKNLFNDKIDQLASSTNPSNIRLLKNENKFIPESLVEEIFTYLENIKTSVLSLSNKKYIFTKVIENLYHKEGLLVTEIFSKLNSQLILCKTNSGIWGVNEINKLIIKQNEPYDFYKLDEGMPIMCTENNNELGISNGDIGVIIGNGKCRRFLFRKFNKYNHQVASLIEPNKLENIIPALAITIHKSQGSESDNVTILWNQNLTKSKDIKNKNKLLLRDNFERRLFYTAITRAKKNLKLYYLNT